MKQLIKNTFNLKYIKQKDITFEMREYFDSVLSKYPNFKNYTNIIIAILNDIEFDSYTCIKCGKQFNFNIQNKTSICPICKMKVTLRGQKAQNKRKATCLARYGVDHPWKSQIIKENIRNTNIKKYGVPVTSQNDMVKQKAKKTCNQRYGGNSPMHSDAVKNKMRQGLIQKYGIDNYFKYMFLQEQLRKDFSNMRRQQLWNTILTYKQYIIPLFEKDILERLNSGKIYKWKCMKCGNIFQTHLHKTLHVVEFPYLPRCLNCYPYLNGISQRQKQLAQFCKQYFPELQQNNRQLIKPYQLDIVIPQIKLAIEFNGIYWHSLEMGTQQTYHLDKVLACNQKGYRLLHIWQDQWVENCDDLKQKLVAIFQNRQIIEQRQHLDFSWFNGPDFNIIKIYQPQIQIRDKFQIVNCGYIDIME